MKSSSLRSILRQDPDVLLIGEIRDEETADIAVKFSLTGHLVFSTVHANDAPSTIARLLDLGIPPFLLGSSLNLIMAQRLIRTIDENEKEEYTPSKNEIDRIGLSNEKNLKYYKGKPAASNHNTGYKGRTMEDMKSFFRPNIKPLKKTKDVWFKNAEFSDESGTVTLTTTEKDSLDAEIKSAVDHMSSVGKFADTIRDSVKPNIKTYINSTIRTGESNGSFGGFVTYLTDKLNTAIDKLKTEKGKEKKAVAMDEVLKYLNTNKSSITAMFDAHKALTKAKTILIRKLEEIKGIGTFVRTDDGFKATAPEGFVAVDDTGKALKLVDRLEFSRSNFTVAKNWVKG